MRKSWEKDENERLIRRINKVADGRGRIMWQTISKLRGRSQKAMEIQWHRELKPQYVWNGKKYVAKKAKAYRDVPRKRVEQKQIKQVRTWLWGLYKVETYD